MKLYDCPSSPHCLKVRTVAYELGVELELVPMNIVRGGWRTPEFEALNPNGLVPVLVDGDFVLWESNAILTYLAGTHRSPALISTDARARADVDRWLHWQSAHLGPAISRVVFERFIKPLTGQPVDHAAAARAAGDFQRCCRVLEASLRDRDYLANQLTVADFAVACFLNSAAMVGLAVQACPRTTAWLGRMLMRDSVRRALAEAGDQVARLVPS